MAKLTKEERASDDAKVLAKLGPEPKMLSAIVDERGGVLGTPGYFPLYRRVKASLTRLQAAGVASARVGSGWVLAKPARAKRPTKTTGDERAIEGAARVAEAIAAAGGQTKRGAK